MTLQYFDWEITSLAQAWIGNPATNYGLELRSESEGSYGWRGFASRENPLAYRPKLVIEYHLPPTPTPTLTPTGSQTPTPTPTSSRTPTPTSSPTRTPTLTSSRTNTPTPTSSPTRTPTSTSSPTATSTPTSSPTNVSTTVLYAVADAYVDSASPTSLAS